MRTADTAPCEPAAGLGGMYSGAASEPESPGVDGARRSAEPRRRSAAACVAALSAASLSASFLAASALSSSSLRVSLAISGQLCGYFQLWLGHVSPFVHFRHASNLQISMAPPEAPT